jgi:hypothetical protein
MLVNFTLRGYPVCVVPQDVCAVQLRHTHLGATTDPEKAPARLLMKGGHKIDVDEAFNDVARMLAVY